MDQRQRHFVANFVKETNVDEELAIDILAGTEWKYEEALRVFNAMLKTNRMPSVKSPTRSALPRSDPSVINNSLKSEKPVHQPPVSPNEKGLHRGISYAHLKAGKGGKALKLPSVSVTEAEEETKVDSHDYYFMLPDLFALAPDLSNIIKKDLLDLEMMKHLHKYSHLNWWSDTHCCAPLYAMNTSGDGNCLLHAASLSIWGMHDRELTVRSALNQMLTDEKFTVKMKKIQRRWKRQQLQVNRELGLEYTAAEWEEEWENVLKLSSVKPRHRVSPDQMTRRQSHGGSMDKITYESLEEIHVFVLAHILLRPIIVISDRLLRDVNGEPLAPNTFGGIYLPLESPSAKCSRSPIVLAYDASHFCPLLPMSSKKSVPNIIPVTDSDRNILQVQFAVDPGLAWKFDEPKNITAELTPEEKFKVLSEYLDLVKIPVSPSERSYKSGKVTFEDLLSRDCIIGVPLSNKRHPEYNTLIKDYIDSARKKSERLSPPSTSVSDATDSHQLPSKKQPVQHPSVMPPKQDNSSGNSGSSSYNRHVLNSATTETRNRGASPKTQTNLHTSSAPVYNSMTIGHSYSRNPNDNRQKRDEGALTWSQTPPNYNTLLSQGTRGNIQRPNVKSPTNRVSSAPHSLHSVGNTSKPCKNSSCQFYGTEKTHFYCTKCYQNFRHS